MIIPYALLVPLLLLNSASASHWTCYRKRMKGIGYDVDAVIADPSGIIIAQTSWHSDWADVYTKKNHRGRMDIRKNFQSWSFAIDGNDYGTFYPAEVNRLENNIDRIAFGCYDTSATDYCTQYNYIRNMYYRWLDEVRDGKLNV
ncbi:hypothetical protein BX616_003281 [Lobosporangium transversale]|uniref:Uncharacterized protein n=1 Tax=Lobosporangium transversale TaxID=64571 RepID=A0A1Y2GQI6_9FUNG|nr:hypothetical protein BCR41DRAFT_386144 [Lobosporangium transversale]KAF9899102.1 hypothetical protein BX616_003281 [Lobosporangium transversale]ORZ17515.1 hypothetical protein BCR41DRAFT_386144 [Lobosporangium transversale]|eukprot:XP_021881902.1 hypothetical protein BCR41DRAFT_386144 [Lobosporangium transversale]